VISIKAYNVTRKKWGCIRGCTSSRAGTCIRKQTPHRDRNIKCTLSIAYMDICFLQNEQEELFSVH
jgi:hypothetical protein